VAYALPYGHYESGVPGASGPLSTDIKAAVPLSLEAGARRSERLYVGAGATWGRVLANGSLNANFEPYSTPSDGNTLRLTVDGQYAFRPGAKVRPWVGLATGLEWVQQGYVTYFGFPYLAVDAGVALPAREPTCLGLFAGVSLGRFQHMDGGRSTALLGSSFNTGLFTGQPATSSSGDIANPAWHGWIEAGIRGCLTI
jgi:hypothetical protein